MSRAERRMTYGEIARRGQRQAFDGRGPLSEYGRRAGSSRRWRQVAEVEADDETGAVRCEKTNRSARHRHDLKPSTHRRSGVGGCGRYGFGYGLIGKSLPTTRRLAKVLAANLGEYGNSSTSRIFPELRTAIIQSDFGSGPYNSASIGEIGADPDRGTAIADAIRRCDRRAHQISADHGGKRIERTQGTLTHTPVAGSG